jgi:hypothetical protein
MGSYGKSISEARSWRTQSSFGDMNRLNCMFTPKSLLPLAALLFAAAFIGCQESLDSPEYGELIHGVPQNLNRPYPLPELEAPTSNPLPGPAPEAAPSEQSAETTAEPTGPKSPPDESSSKAEKNPE